MKKKVILSQTLEPPENIMVNREKKKHSYLYQRHVTEVQSEQVISGLERWGETEICECVHM